MENKILTVNLLLEVLKSIEAAGYGDKPLSMRFCDGCDDYASFVRPIVDKDKNIIEYEISNC